MILLGFFPSIMNLCLARVTPTLFLHLEARFGPYCPEFSHYAQFYDVTRQPCKDTGSITCGNIQLMDGSCENTILPADKQLVITNSELFLGIWYMLSLVEFWGAFATTRNQS